MEINQILKWFNQIAIKANPDKFHVLLITKEDKYVTITIEKKKNSKSEKLLTFNF